MAVSAGADAVGVVCHADAPRAVGRDAVREISSEIPPFVTLVMLFVNPPHGAVEECLDIAPHAWLQFHGSEDPELCMGFGAPYIKSLRPSADGDVARAMRDYEFAASLLVDGGAGTGEAFDWSHVPPRAERTLPLIVAGGLDPSNVAAAIALTDPDAVDVSSGVCADGDPLRKDPAKVAAFVAAAKGAGANGGG